MIGFFRFPAWTVLFSEVLLPLWRVSAPDAIWNNGFCCLFYNYSQIMWKHPWGDDLATVGKPASWYYVSRPWHNEFHALLRSLPTSSETLFPLRCFSRHQPPIFYRGNRGTLMALHNMRKFAAFDDFPRQDRSILSAQDCFCCFVWLCFGNMVYLHYRFGLHPSWYFPKQLKDLHICSIFIFIAKDKKIIIIYNKINQNIKVFFCFVYCTWKPQL